MIYDCPNKKCATRFSSFLPPMKCPLCDTNMAVPRVTCAGRQAGKVTAALEYITTIVPNMTNEELKIMAQANLGSNKPYSLGIIELLDKELARRNLGVKLENGSVLIVPL